MKNMETIKLNVGGRRFEVSRALLKAHPNNSILFFLDDDEEEDVSSSQVYDHDKDDEVSFDRDGHMFQYVLQYMKDGKVDLPSTLTMETFIKEMEHYNLEYDKENIKSERNEDHEAGKSELDSLKETLESMREEEEEAHLVYHSRALARVLYEKFIISIVKTHVDESSENIYPLNGEKYYRFTLKIRGHEDNIQNEEIHEDKFKMFIDKHGTVAIMAMMNSILKSIEITSIVELSSSLIKKRNIPFGLPATKEEADSMSTQHPSPCTESLISLKTDKVDTKTPKISKATNLFGSKNSAVATDSFISSTGRKIVSASRSNATSTTSSSGTSFNFGPSNPFANVNFAPSIGSTKGLKFSFGSSTCASKPISFELGSKPGKRAMKESQTMSVKAQNLKQNVDVRIYNVKSQPELNGKIGTILTWIENKERYNIYVSSLEKNFALRPANVVLEPGTVGYITGLQSNLELNGKLGTIKNWVGDSNKYDVQLECQQVIRINVENLIVKQFLDKMHTSDETTKNNSQQMKILPTSHSIKASSAAMKDSISLPTAYPPLSAKAPSHENIFPAVFTPLEAAPVTYAFESSTPAPAPFGVSLSSSARAPTNTGYSKKSIGKQKVSSGSSALPPKLTNAHFLFGATKTSNPYSTSSNNEKSSRSANPCTTFGVSHSNTASPSAKFTFGSHIPLSSVNKSSEEYGSQFQKKSENVKVQNNVKTIDNQSIEQQLLVTESKIAKKLQKEGKYDEAEPLFKKCHLLSEAIHGYNHPDTLSFMNDLASVLEKRAEYIMAESLFSDCLVCREASLGPVHQDTLLSMRNLANVYRLQKKYDKAEKLYDLCLSKMKSILAYDHLTLLAMYGRSVVYFEKGEKVKAEAELSDCLSKSEKSLGVDHPDTLEFKYALAIMHLEIGEIERARPSLFSSFAKRMATLGSQHPDTIEVMRSLADLHWRQGKYDIAESILKDCLSITKEAYGPTHRLTFTSLLDLASFYNLRMAFDRAQLLYMEWNIIAPNFPFTKVHCTKRETLSACMEGKYNIAEKLHERCISHNHNKDHPDALDAMFNYALFLHDVKKNDEKAIQLLNECLSRRESTLGPHHQDTINTRHILRYYSRKRSIQ